MPFYEMNSPMSTFYSEQYYKGSKRMVNYFTIH